MDDAAVVAGSEFGFQNCMGASWIILRDHWFSLLSVACLRELISTLAAGLAFAILIDWKVWSLVIALLVRCLVWSAIQAGYLKFCLNLCENGRVQWRDLLTGAASGFQMLFATFCLWLAIGLGLILVVVPGLFLAVRFSLYGFALVDKRLPALKSLAASNQMLKGSGGFAAGIMLVYCAGICLFGWLTFGFDSLLAISLCKLYKHLKQLEYLKQQEIGV